MTVGISAARTSALAAAGDTNRPILLWDNVLDGGSRTITTTGGTAASDGDAENATNGTTWSYWKATPSTAATAVNMQVVFPVNRTLGACGIAAHNLATLGATLSFQMSTNSGSTWSDIATATPADSSAILLYGVASSTNYYRLRVSGIDDTKQVQIGVVGFGQPTVIPRRFWQAYQQPGTPNRVELQSNVSEGGHLLGSTVVRRGSEMQVDLDRLTPAFARGADWRGFEAHFNEGRGFWWAWRPATYGDCVYGWRSARAAALAAVNTGPLDFMGAAMGFQFYDG